MPHTVAVDLVTDCRRPIRAHFPSTTTTSSSLSVERPGHMYDFTSTYQAIVSAAACDDFKLSILHGYLSNNILQIAETGAGGEVGVGNCVAVSNV